MIMADITPPNSPEPSSLRRRRDDVEHDRIFEILERIERAQVNLEKKLLARAYIDDKVTALDKTINGNGKAGMKEELQDVQNQVNLIRVDIIRVTWAAGIAIAALIAQAIEHFFP